jgi:3-dehydroquinate dehydratase/shikimate dehydrogenase
VEVRLDRFRETPDLAGIREAFRDSTLLATVRSEAEGGGFSGSEDEQRNLLSGALSAGFDLIDVEFHRLASWPTGTPAERVIVSCHDTAGIPDEPERLLEKMLETGTRVAKLVCSPSTSRQACRLLQLQDSFRDRPTAVFGMGEAGLLTRTLAPYLGAHLAYGALRPGKVTAPGQIGALDLAEVYGVGTNRQIEALYALFGGLVSHSFSPALHNGVFQKSDLPHFYVPVAMKSLVDEFEPLVGVLDGLGLPLRGASVTIPFKRDVRHVAIYHSEGPANTLLRLGDGFKSANTDREAMLQLIPRASAGSMALILGSGGTSEIAASALIELGYSVHVSTRSPEKAETWTSETDPLPCPESLIEPGVLIFDAPYHPGGTRFVQTAKDRGATPISGLRFLLEQAVLQSRWFTSLPITPRRMVEALSPRHRSLFEVFS